MPITLLPLIRRDDDAHQSGCFAAHQQARLATDPKAGHTPALLACTGPGARALTDPRPVAELAEDVSFDLTPLPAWADLTRPRAGPRSRR